MSGSSYFEDYDKAKANCLQQNGKRLCLNYFFKTNLSKKKPVLFNIPVVWLIKPTVRNWNRTFSEKQR